MWIKAFSHFIIKHACLEETLYECPLIIDMHNFFYMSYDESGLPSKWGCEYDMYAEHIRKMLTPFKKAKIDCYFVNHSGHRNIKQKLNDRLKFGLSPHSGKEKNKDVIRDDVHEEVIKEMGFKYIVVEYDWKEKCVALSKSLNACIVCNDVEYCFTGAPYIAKRDYNEDTSTFKCSVFRLEKFMEKFKLEKYHLGFFIMFANTENEPLFLKYMKSHHIYKKVREDTLISLLNYLSQEPSADEIMNKLEIMYGKDSETMSSILQLANQIQDRLDSWELTPDNMSDSSVVDLVDLSVGAVDLLYTNLRRSKVLSETSTNLYDFVDQPILQYILDLVTSFENEGFTVFYYKTGYVVRKEHVPADRYRTDDLCRILKCNLTEGNIITKDVGKDLLYKFLNVYGVKPALSGVADEAQMLVITACFYALRRDEDCGKIVYGALAAFAAVTERAIIQFDDIPNDDDGNIGDELQQFINCLHHLCNLNRLVGSPIPPMKFSSSWRSSLAYKFAVTGARVRGVDILLNAFQINVPNHKCTFGFVRK